MKTDRNPQGIEIVFDAKKHIYTVDGTQYKSVTTFIKDYFPVFDTENIAARYAKKHGLNKDDIINKWEKIKTDAANLGTKTHEYAENKLLGIKQKLPKDPVLRERCKQASKAIKKLKKHYEILDVEKMLFNCKYKIAGTVDLIMRCKKTGDLVIGDWKTSKDIKETNPYQRGLYCLNHLDDCNYNKFSIQLGIYQALCELGEYYENAEEIRLGIIHIKEDSFEMIPIKYLWVEVHNMLKDVEK